MDRNGSFCMMPNDPSSRARFTGRVDCDLDVLAGFLAVHGWATRSRAHLLSD
jgi:hypothetical protein